MGMDTHYVNKLIAHLANKENECKTLHENWSNLAEVIDILTSNSIPINHEQFGEGFFISKTWFDHLLLSVKKEEK